MVIASREKCSIFSEVGLIHPVKGAFKYGILVFLDVNCVWGDRMVDKQRTGFPPHWFLGKVPRGDVDDQSGFGKFNRTGLPNVPLTLPRGSLKVSPRPERTNQEAIETGGCGQTVQQEGCCTRVCESFAWLYGSVKGIKRLNPPQSCSRWTSIPEGS